MNIQYHENRFIPTDSLTALYDAVGWTAYTDKPQVMAGLLTGSLYHLSA